MGGFRGINKYYCALFLALLACHELVSTHGRQMKARKQYSWLNTDATESLRNTPPAHTLVPDVASSAEKKVDGTDRVGATSVKAHRPTTPGNSPGVGHRHKQMMKTKVVVHSPESGNFVTTQGRQNDFRPTVPSHSPGVGHAYQHNIGDR